MDTAEIAHHGQNDLSTTNSPYLSRAVNRSAGPISPINNDVGHGASAVCTNAPATATTKIAAGRAPATASRPLSCG